MPVVRARQRRMSSVVGVYDGAAMRSTLSSTYLAESGSCRRERFSKARCVAGSFQMALTSLASSGLSPSDRLLVAVNLPATAANSGASW